MNKISLPEIVDAVRAIMRAVDTGSIALAHAREFFKAEGISDADLRALDADYDRRIAEAEERAKATP